MTDTMIRDTEGSCGCGCGDPAKADSSTASGEGCGCGCGTSVAETPALTAAREVAHLTSLRQSIDRRLAELKS